VRRCLNEEWWIVGNIVCKQFCLFILKLSIPCIYRIIIIF